MFRTLQSYCTEHACADSDAAKRAGALELKRVIAAHSLKLAQHLALFAGTLERVRDVFVRAETTAHMAAPKPLVVESPTEVTVETLLLRLQNTRDLLVDTEAHATRFLVSATCEHTTVATPGLVPAEEPEVGRLQSKTKKLSLVSLSDVLLMLLLLLLLWQQHEVRVFDVKRVETLLGKEVKNKTCLTVDAQANTVFTGKGKGETEEDKSYDHSQVCLLSLFKAIENCVPL